MRLGRWPWVLFAVIAVPLATRNDLEGILYVAVPLAIVTDSMLAVHRHSRAVACTYIVSNAVAMAAVVQLAANDDVSPLIRGVDGTTVALLISSRTLAFLCTFYVISRSHHSTAVRTFAYCTFMYVVQVLAVLHLRELTRVLDLYSVDETTRVPCVEPTTNSSGFIFPEQPYFKTCPTRVWEHARVNLLFASQLYVLYTLTTDLNYDFEITTSEAGRSDVYVLGGLAVLETFALCVAVSMQFDVIAGCNTLSWDVGFLLIVSALTHAVRRLACMRREPDTLMGRYHSLRAPVQSLRHVKLKL